MKTILQATFCALYLSGALLMPAAHAQDPAELIEDLTARSEKTRADAARQLGEMGAVDAAPALGEALRDSSPLVRSRATVALWKLGEAARPQIPALTATLEDTDQFVVSNTILALEDLNIGFDALEPAYRRLLSATDCGPRLRGIAGLVKRTSAVELFPMTLDCAVSKQEVQNGLDAGKILRDILKTQDRALVQPILTALGDASVAMPYELFSTIGAYRPPVPEAVPVLGAQLESPHSTNRKYAADALAKIGEPALGALPWLLPLLRDDTDANIRESAATAIGAIGERAASTAAEQLHGSAFNDVEIKVRAAAMEALGNMGAAAAGYKDQLYKTLTDTQTDFKLKIASRNALYKLDSKRSTAVHQAWAAATSKSGESVAADAPLPLEKPAEVIQMLATHSANAVQLMLMDSSATLTTVTDASKKMASLYSYSAGKVTGPFAQPTACTKQFALAQLDTSLLPQMMSQAPAELGTPDGAISHVSYGGDFSCSAPSWAVFVKTGHSMVGNVRFDAKGKVTKVQKAPGR
ncbi:MAG: HEAT repeat domain-containing protein [Pseudomonadota bacterium]|nr:HEAT repeat domain-containing protein [Pseudomonadota bacterium]